MSERRGLYRLGLALHRRARLVVALSTLVLIVCAVFGVGVFSRLLSGGFDDPASDSAEAAAELTARFDGEPNMIFLVHARAGTVDQPAVTTDAQALTTRLTHDSRLRGVTSYWTTHAPGLRSGTAPTRWSWPAWPATNSGPATTPKRSGGTTAACPTRR